MPVFTSRIQLVDRPALDADVRFTFTDDGLTVRRGFSIGAPSMIGDVGSVAPEYGYRPISIPLSVRGPESFALRRMVELARELQRDETWLLVWLTESMRPVWYKVLRSAPGEASLGELFLDEREHSWVFDVSLVAESHGYGELETIGPVTIGNDPANDGLVYELPEILGDAPAPLNVDIAAGTTSWARPWLSVIPLDGTWPGGAVFWQGESFTLSNGATTSSSGTASGGSRAVLSLAYSGSGGTTVARTLTKSVTVPFAGRYRLFARCTTVSSGVAGMSATVEGAGAAVADPVTTSLGSGQARMVDLGSYAFPKGNMPSARPYTLAAAEVGIDVGGEFGSFGGSGTVSVDYVVAIPLDVPLDRRDFGRVLEFQQVTQTRGDVVIRLDAEREAVQELTSGEFEVASPEVPSGGFLHVSPGASNVLTFMPRRNSGGTSWFYDDQITHTTTLTLSYHPRHLYVAGA